MGTPAYERDYTLVPLPFDLQFPISKNPAEWNRHKPLWRVSSLFIYNLSLIDHLISATNRNGTNFQDSSAAFAT